GITDAIRRYRNFAPFVCQTSERKPQPCVKGDLTSAIRLQRPLGKAACRREQIHAPLQWLLLGAPLRTRCGEPFPSQAVFSFLGSGFRSSIGVYRGAERSSSNQGHSN